MSLVSNKCCFWLKANILHICVTMNISMTQVMIFSKKPENFIYIYILIITNRNTLVTQSFDEECAPKKEVCSRIE